MSDTARAVGQPSVWANVVSDAPVALRDWLVSIGFVEDLLIPGEQEGAIHHCQLDWPGGGGVLLSGVGERPTPCRPGTAWLHVVTSDPDAVWAQVLSAGAEIVEAITDRSDYPAREFTAADPEGNHWTFSTYAG